MFRLVYTVAIISALYGVARADTSARDCEDKVDSGDLRIEACSIAIEREPQNPSLYFYRGWEWENHFAAFEKAIVDYTMAIKFSPGNGLPLYARGNAYSSLGRCDKAIKDYGEALELGYVARELVFNNRALCWSKSRQYRKAIDDLNEVLMITPDDAVVYNTRGAAWRDLGDYANAIADFQQAIKIDPSFADAQKNLEIARRIAEQTNGEKSGEGSAATTNQRSFVVSKSQDMVSLSEQADLKMARDLSKSAAEAYNAGNLDGAEALYRHALYLREKILGPDNSIVAANILNLAAALSAKGSYSESEALNRRSLAIFEKLLGPDDPKTAGSLNNLAELLRIKADYVGAERLYRRALATDEKVLGTENPDTAAIINNLGILLDLKGDYDGAERQHRRALAIREKIFEEDHADTAESLNNLAILLDRKGDDDEAKSLYERALAIREKVLGTENRDTAASLSNLGTLLYKKGDYENAETLYRRALEIRESVLGPEHPETSGSLANLAILLGRMGKYDEAESLYRRALVVDEKVLGPNHPDTASQLNNLAGLLYEKEDYVGAVSLARRALAINEKALGITHSNTAQNLNSLAFMLEKDGAWREALDLSRKASAAGYPDRNVYLGALQSSDVRSVPVISESLSVIQLTMSSEAGAALANLSARFGAGDGKLAVLVREEQDLGNEIASLDKTYLESIGKPAAERSRQREQALQSEIGKLKDRLASAQERLTAGFPDYAELQKPRSLALSEAQALLKKDEALVIIDTVSDGNGDYIWAVTADDANWQKLETSKGEIDDLVTGLLPALNPGNQAVIDTGKAYRLYQLTLGKVEKQVSGKKHLMFVLNGAMTSLPPHVLVTRDPANKSSEDIEVSAAANQASRGLSQADDDSEDTSGNVSSGETMSKPLGDVDWLIRDHAITVLPTVSSLKLLRSGKTAAAAMKPMRGYADIAYAPGGGEGHTDVASRGIGDVFTSGVANTSVLQGANPLPATGPEARAVMEVLGGDESDIITGRAASEAEVKAANLSDYRVLYFATHGLLAGEVEELAKVKAEPALLFAVPEKPTPEDDGLLTASEVAQLKLNADWAVLSACNTAAGGKPGAAALSGLARAFFYAGARSLLVSHWPVDDEATKALMVRLFETVKANPSMRAAEAQQEAMLSVMNDQNHPRWANPAYWAPFILVGEPR